MENIRAYNIKKVISATALGSALEWYEFTIFAQFSAIISKLFFPNQDEFLSLINTFGIFALGFIIRPIGALLFGYIGDKYGRKKGLVFSMLLMAFPTACIGLLPTYASIGIYAPLGLAFFRILQGLSIGGENGGAVTYAIEHAPIKKQNIVGAIVQSSVCLGVLLGSFSTYLISSSLSAENLENWGWRIPFLFGLILGTIGILIRYYLDDTPAYKNILHNNRVSSNPLKDLLLYKTKVITAIVIFIPTVFSFFTLSVFTQSFIHKVLNYPFPIVMKYNSLAILVSMIVTPISGYLADKYGNKNILLIGIFCIIVYLYPMTILLNSGDFCYAIIAQQIYAVLTGLYSGSIFAYLINLFPTYIRFTGVNFSMSIASSIFGGTVPLIGFSLIGNFGTPQGLFLLSIYLITLGIISFIALMIVKQTKFGHH